VTYLIDSDVVVHWLRGSQSAVSLLTNLEPEGIAISLVTYGEIYEGLYFGRDQRRGVQGFHRFLQSADVLPLNRRIMRRFALIRGTLRQQGMLINDPDLLIAVTAIYHDLTLVTGNVRHFQRVPDLKLHS
jgi:predicted nucleic acid-binding protein